MTPHGNEVPFRARLSIWICCLNGVEEATNICPGCRYESHGPMEAEIDW
jgi:hypothetical protein